MSKELEALKQIKSIAKKDIVHGDWSEDVSIKIIEAYLTPPTADEVCEALSDHYGRKVTFKDNMFWYKIIIYDNEQWVRDVSLKDLAKDNRGDLITLIGRFYEGLEAQ